MEGGNLAPPPPLDHLGFNACESTEAEGEKYSAITWVRQEEEAREEGEQRRSSSAAEASPPPSAGEGPFSSYRAPSHLTELLRYDPMTGSVLKPRVCEPVGPRAALASDGVDP